MHYGGRLLSFAFGSPSPRRHRIPYTNILSRILTVAMTRVFPPRRVPSGVSSAFRRQTRKPFGPGVSAASEMSTLPGHSTESG